MIFDSPKIEKLRNRYAKVRVDRKPWIVLLDEMSHFEEERILLERLLEESPAQTRQDLLQKLLSDQQGQQVGAWFQLMLFDWLKAANLGQVEIDPTIDGNVPDFILKGHNPPIIVEARARQESPEVAAENEWLYLIQHVLTNIEMPFSIFVEVEQIKSKVDQGDFRQQVVTWLQEHPDEEFRYKDISGSSVAMTAVYHERSETVSAMISMPVSTINGDSLRNPIRDKARQHNGLKSKDFCYVLALFLKDSSLSAEEIQEAWFGQTVGLIDPKTRSILELTTDSTGLHYGHKGIQHKSVSGTLVFMADVDHFAKRRRLRAWYIQNPYATSPVDPWFFPAESRFLIVEQTQTSFKMGWRQDKSQLDQL